MKAFWEWAREDQNTWYLLGWLALMLSIWGIGNVTAFAVTAMVCFAASNIVFHIRQQGAKTQAALAKLEQEKKYENLLR